MIRIFDHADAETGYVVIFAVVHARHFSGFAAHQRTAGLFAAFGDAGDHAGRGVHIQLAGGVVVEEEQRLGALNHQIVDAHRHQIDADGVVAFQIHRQTQLGAHAVGTGNQHRLAVFLRQRTQGAKPAQTAHHFRATGLFNYTFDAVYQCVACIDIDTCVFIAERGFVGHCAIPHDGLRFENCASDVDSGIRRGNSNSAGKRLRAACEPAPLFRHLY